MIYDWTGVQLHIFIDGKDIKSMHGRMHGLGVIVLHGSKRPSACDGVRYVGGDALAFICSSSSPERRPHANCLGCQLGRLQGYSPKSACFDACG